MFIVQADTDAQLKIIVDCDYPGYFFATTGRYDANFILTLVQHEIAALEAAIGVYFDVQVVIDADGGIGGETVPLTVVNPQLVPLPSNGDVISKERELSVVSLGCCWHPAVAGIIRIANTRIVSSLFISHLRPNRTTVK
jgi:hypothetical protein